MALLDRVLADDNLMFAWSRVRDNDGAPGTDGVRLEDFGRNAIVHLARLREQVRDGRYVPQPLLRVALSRPGREPRLLGIPSVRDRILQTAVALVLGPVLDRHFEDESYAYRPGRSVRQAVERVAELRDAGFTVIVDADIHGFFDHISHDQLLARLSNHLDDSSLLALIGTWLSTPIQTAHGLVRPLAGVAQGSPLSPLLANLYLDGFDEAIAVGERRLVRYADDFVILCRTVEAAEEALEDAARWLGAAGLELNYDKTRIATFAQGIAFLGVRFTETEVVAEDPAAAPWVLPPRYRKQRNASPGGPKAPARQGKARRQPSASAPPLPPLPPRSDPVPPRPPAAVPERETRFDDDAAPLLRTLYLAEPGAYLHKQGGRLVANRGDEALIDVPLEKVDQVLVADEGAISFGALRALLLRGGSVVVQGLAGEPLGAFVNLADSRVELRRGQHRRADDADFCLAAARAIVAGKIGNQRLVLRRYYRFRPEMKNGADASLRELQSAALKAPTLEATRGCEGAAARAYFAAWGALLPAPWSMTGRSKHPPRDPVNALLSYGYGVLFHNLLSLVVQRGLDPHLGALHAPRNGHPALVSDLMEEFRAIAVDVVVLNLLQRGHVTPREFTQETPESPCRMLPSARKALIRALEDKMASELIHPLTGQSGDYRRAMRQQVAHWIEVVEGSAPTYRPCVLR